MDIVKVRQQRLKEWFAEMKLPPKDASFISQVIGGKTIGERAARRLEREYGMPEFFLDTPPDQPISAEPAATPGTSVKYARVIEILESLPDDEVDEFLKKLEEKKAFYDRRFKEYLLKNSGKII
ncbi:hypothetical protein FMK81_13200 [Klebsiella oxytoca]|uniref:hypothetical protein n=1 Tax=Klebsiella oxytoca TaxID=571 RepID=UPI001CCDD410|nr:hypothetical protein [Klebsiella oxytoca]MBZ7262463.1 hypothetical protein [Klebsiella oxytoca]